MNIEDYRDYCLSLGADVEEKLPFTMFKSVTCNEHIRMLPYTKQ